MAGFTGKDLYVIFGSTVLDTDYRAFGESEEIGTVEDSAGSDANRHYLTTLLDGTAPLTIVIQSDDSTTWAAVLPGTSGTLDWAEEGTASGKVRHYVDAIVTSREKSMSYDDLVVADLTFQFNSAVTETNY